MRSLTRWRWVAFGGSALVAALTFVVARCATDHYERQSAEQSAVTIAAYLSIAAPPDRGGSGYDLAQLLIQARAVAALLKLPQAEVYYATAPLVHAVAPPLSPAELERLRREETMTWDDNTALVPLFDREGWNVVGAVRVPRPRLAVSWLMQGLPAMLLLTLACAAYSANAIGHPVVQQKALVLYTAVALVVGCAAYLAARTAAKRATDRWLIETGALVQEATTHAPGGLGIADVASIVRGGTLVPAEILIRDPAPRRLNRGAVAAVVVRMGGGRWAELRVLALEVTTGLWFVCTIGLALLGPAGVWLAGRARASPSSFSFFLRRSAA